MPPRNPYILDRRIGLIRNAYTTMTNGKKALFIASAIAALGVSALSAGTVFAAQRSPGHAGRNMSGLVNAIAKRFHLAPADVQSVFDEQHQAMSDQMKQRFADRLAASLTQAVKDGKLTQAQADLITTKQTEIKTFMDGLKDKSKADRQTAITTEIASVKAWAQANNIPEQYVAPFGGGGMHRGGEMGGPGRGWPAHTQTPERQ